MSSSNQVSSQVRRAAIRVLTNASRPMSTHEIENHIRNHHSDLWSLILPKCCDYVRIILSVTHDGTLIKYKAKKNIRGVDKRSTFYGLSNRHYSENDWQKLTTHVHKTTAEQTIDQSKTEITEEHEQLSSPEQRPSSASSIFDLSDLYNDVFSSSESTSFFDYGFLGNTFN